ncbi:delta endotoxin C-terminal domain-containing protein, partial [Yersinia sp. 1252 StPb PI]|uniref:delta endotoxin C-terminal domain-containing protein n=1 Tax=Yersinia sp. 1252 StPb PI TaxID=3117404 RepID=UPI003B27DEEA
DIILLDKDKTWNHNYLFKWYHSCVNKSMLQNSDVIPSNDKHLCLQFHAIRAYFSINSDNLEIVPGPGFTGGDLVKVTPGKKVLFKLDRDGYNKWFKGFYNVRVWFLRDIGDADLSVNIRSNNSFPTSNVRGKVSLGGRHTNPLDAMQDDIMYHQYDSSVLLFNEMPFVVIEVENLSLDK